MTIKEIAKSLQNDKINSEQYESLIRAEAQLIKAAVPHMDKLSLEEIAERRYMQSPAHSQLAALDMAHVASIIMAGGNATYPANGQTVQLAEKVILTGEQLWEYEWKYQNDSAEIEETRRRSEGLRRSRGDVQNEFERLLNGEITVESFWEYVDGIEVYLEQHMYDEDYQEEIGQQIAYPTRQPL